MSGPIHVTAIFKVKPGKGARFQEITEKAVKHVRENEPFVLSYECLWGERDLSTGQITSAAAREVYENQAAFEKHREGPAVRDLMQALQADDLAESVAFVHSQAGDKTGFSRL